MLMGFPADMALLEKARDDDAKVGEAAERSKKALAERVAAARTVGTRRERASISHEGLASTSLLLEVGRGGARALCHAPQRSEQRATCRRFLPAFQAEFPLVGAFGAIRVRAEAGKQTSDESKSHLLDEGRELEVLTAFCI